MLHKNPQKTNCTFDDRKKKLLTQKKNLICKQDNVLNINNANGNIDFCFFLLNTDAIGASDFLI